MPAANVQLQHRAVDHAVDLRHYSNGVLRRMIALLNRSDVQLALALTAALMRMERDTFTVERLEALLGSVRTINAQAYRAVDAALQTELRELAAVEVQHQAVSLRATVPAAVQLQFPIAAVSAEQVYAAAMARPFQGRLLSGWAANVEASRMALIRNAVRNGVVTGQTTAEIVRTIKGTQALKYADGLLDRPRRELMAVVQTALSHTAQRARAEFVKANADLVKAVMWVSTLDNRTTPECAARDGLLYSADDHTPIDHGIPWLGGPGALHFNCRSVDVPVLKSWKELGIDAADAPPGTRASMDGQVPADLTYGEWLGNQSAARQDEILGPVRGAMLRSGAKFERFSDDRGQWLSLADLKKRAG